MERSRKKDTDFLLSDFGRDELNMGESQNEKGICHLQKRKV